ncbi:hypothetical protein BZA70DRAFT_132531 [Myxozyma melibiosi]|uniref:HIG1 domain-containing protein n=1 Tax=Myxozyma melibiosi TaxID=54550 RepID=A0ABR1F924_9ASCO
MADDDPTKFNAEQRLDYERRMKIAGAVKGLVGGAALGLGANLFAKKKFPLAFKSPTIRVALLVIPTVGLAKVGMEQEYHHAMLRERGVYQIQEKEKALTTGVDYHQLSTTGRILAFSKENKLSLLLSAWAGSMGLAWYMISRDKLLTGSQKIVQARMYAQFLALGLIVATAAVSIGDSSEPAYIPDPNDKTHHHLIHNPKNKSHQSGVESHWKMIIEEEEEARKNE